MKIGVLSDSHGRAAMTALAISALRSAGAELLLHLGDLGSNEVIEELAGQDARIVLGNCDDPPEPLIRTARSLDIAVDHPMGWVTAAGKRIAYTHGHLEDLMAQALEAGVDYLLHGHSHELRDERIGRTRVINPGALFRAARYTAAVLDPAADELTIIDVARVQADSRA